MRTNLLIIVVCLVFAGINVEISKSAPGPGKIFKPNSLTILRLPVTIN
ncbi:MAG: hypothetical protein JW715_11860 [Sedimentisphaerales bacterium]|nr:hypothetical protein [Sedimentisphaerales bacterium]